MTTRPALAALALTLACTADAALDLRNASRHTLDNGLTVLLLEDASFPLVSVQMLYRVGARDELPGRSGLAHFVEHLAFRGSEGFPDTGLVSSIYAVGGEWHGYTWIDQTTYFATAPREHLELLLGIERERMTKLRIGHDEIDAEKGAVLAEMQGYENDPAAVLFDATLFAALVAHPYRNNTIGFASDVAGFTYDDVRAFYRQHYRPANAVLAVVGDIDAGATLARIRELFAEVADGAPTPLPRAQEPPQNGERRVRVTHPATRSFFQVAWHAPAATHPDFAAFLLLQELIGGSGGVNFLHNEFGTPVDDDSPLAAVRDALAGEVATWFIPTAQPYVFLVKGSVPADADEAALEASVQATVAGLQEDTVAAARFDAARERLLATLLLDLQTTEDAAHQLAYFEGIAALDVLVELPARIAALTPDDVRRVARHWLGPRQRTIGWLVDGRPGARPAAPAAPTVDPGEPPPPNRDPAPPPAVLRLSNGLPVILQQSPLAASVHLQVTLRGAWESAGGALAANRPVAGWTSFGETVAADDLAALALRAAAAVSQARPATRAAPAAQDPRLRFEEVVARCWTRATTGRAPSPALVVLAGDFEARSAMAVLEDAFGQPGRSTAVSGDAVSQERAPPAADDIDRCRYPRSGASTAGPVLEHIALPLAQARLGYLVPAPPPDDPAADAWRALLYVVSHDYEGRLGKEAISRRGLVYYIDSQYRSDGVDGLITLSAGVDPAKLAAMRTLLEAELARLSAEPPTAAEIAEAVRHRLGRARSANQSNAELAAGLGRDWLWHGGLVSCDELSARLEALRREDVLRAVDGFVRGTVVTVSVEREP